eukprot:CAMPEP_0167772216 /NCGR_PEP_ID=MMETSP0111_2-20121227/722_1 /TAXON_ID=91324 /ORGANISM="Lotharella globosa, Strain CCCM811" /LENGTH=183 /DNA_ID=CAMNT_0007661679 /DNA_START=699 /DNA_END=1247 /DNA_ORIENTATION=-
MFHAHTLMKSRTNHTPVPPWVSHPQDDTCTDKIQEEDKLKVAKKKILLACQRQDWTVVCDGSANKKDCEIGGAWARHKLKSGKVRRVGRTRQVNFSCIGTPFLSEALTSHRAMMIMRKACPGKSVAFGLDCQGVIRAINSAKDSQCDIMEALKVERRRWRKLATLLHVPAHINCRLHENIDKK